MPTRRQRTAVDKIVENGGNVSKAMRESGYTAETAKTPSKLTDSKGFMQILEEIGLTDQFLTKALYEDIESKKRNRKPELELAYKIRGRLKETVDVTSNGETISFGNVVPRPKNE